MSATAAPSTTESVIQSLHLTANEIRFYQNEGYLYLPGLVSAEAAALRAEVMDIMDALRLDRSNLGRATSAADKLRQTHQYLRGSRLDAMVNGEALRSIASQLIEGPARLYLPFTAVKAGGGGGQFHFHQDNQYTPHDPGMGSINIWFALNDMTPENGCLRICPRSHLHGTLDATLSGDGDSHRKVTFEPEDFLPLRMRAGDAVAFSRLTVHGSGANETGEPRVAYAVQYHREDVRFQLRDEPDAPWQLLKGADRWGHIGPVDRITPPNDGVTPN